MRARALGHHAQYSQTAHSSSTFGGHSLVFGNHSLQQSQQLPLHTHCHLHQTFQHIILGVDSSKQGEPWELRFSKPQPQSLKCSSIICIFSQLHRSTNTAILQKQYFGKCCPRNIFFSSLPCFREAKHLYFKINWLLEYKTKLKILWRPVIGLINKQLHAFK